MKTARVNVPVTNSTRSVVVEGAVEDVATVVGNHLFEQLVFPGLGFTVNVPPRGVQGMVTPLEEPTFNWTTEREPVSTVRGGLLNPLSPSTPEYDYSGAAGAHPHGNNGGAPLQSPSFNWSSADGAVNSNDLGSTNNPQGRAGDGVSGPPTAYLNNGPCTTTPLVSPTINWSDEESADDAANRATKAMPELSLW
jgi:hypothetical protein